MLISVRESTKSIFCAQLLFTISIQKLWEFRRAQHTRRVVGFMTVVKLEFWHFQLKRVVGNVNWNYEAKVK